MVKLTITFKGRLPFVQWFGCRDTAYSTLDVYMKTALVTGYRIEIEEKTDLQSKRLALVQ